MGHRISPIIKRYVDYWLLLVISGILAAVVNG